MNKKKLVNALMIAGVSAAVIAVGVLNYFVTSDTKTSAKEVVAQATEQVTDAFSEYKGERETTRAKEMSYIDSVANSTEATDEEKQEAKSKKLAMIDDMDSEMVMEGLIKTKIGSEAVVSIGDDYVNVVVNKADLSEDEVVKIADIVKSETGKPSSNIKIMPKL